MALTHTAFGDAQGQPIECYTLQNAQGILAEIITYGGAVRRLCTPDRYGQLGDIVLGFEQIEQYLNPQPYFGALIGRYGNRIANGTFMLNGQRYTLAQNNGANNLHGGPIGFDRVVWQAEPRAQGDAPSLALHYTSPHGDQGFPGTLLVTVVYTLAADNTFHIDYTATTDQDTVVNLTNHTYFNLAGGGDILNHQLTLPAACFVPVSSALIPTGKLQPVAHTPMDFRSPQRIGERIGSADAQIHAAGGYDHTWVIDRTTEGLALAAHLADPHSGRVLAVYTTEPGVQFYSGNFLDGTLVGKYGVRYHNHAGLCLETQHFPDSPNQPQFPSAVLGPGQTYRSRTVWHFLAE